MTRFKRAFLQALCALIAADFTGHAWAGEPTQFDDKLAEQIVDQFGIVAGGAHKGYRANHAKGVLVSGQFEPAPGAAALSMAAHLQASPSPVLVRFSTSTGVPQIPDTDPNANPFGMAIRFHLADGSDTDLVAISSPIFPAANAQDFLAFLQAVAASGPAVAHPTPIERFVGTHPVAMRFVTTARALPTSFADTAFFGLNTFTFTNAKGQVQYGRYRVSPVDGAKVQGAAAKPGPNYLFEDLPSRLKQGPARYRITVQLAGKGDAVNDSATLWPEDRPQLELGVLTLDTIVADGPQRELRLAFNPLNVTEGIAASDDPLLLARGASYPVSVSRRLRDQ